MLTRPPPPIFTQRSVEENIDRVVKAFFGAKSETKLYLPYSNRTNSNVKEYFNSTCFLDLLRLPATEKLPFILRTRSDFISSYKYEGLSLEENHFAGVWYITFFHPGAKGSPEIFRDQLKNSACKVRVQSTLLSNLKIGTPGVEEEEENSSSSEDEIVFDPAPPHKVKQYLVDMNRNGHHEIAFDNGSHNHHWFRVSKKQEGSIQRPDRRPTSLKPICLAIGGGDLKLGITIMMKSLIAMDPDIAGEAACEAGRRFKTTQRLNVIETAAIVSEANLTGSQFSTLKRHLKHQLGYEMLAPKGKVMAVGRLNSVPMDFHKYSVSIKQGKATAKKVEYNYWIKNFEAVVESVLRATVDQGLELGLELGVTGKRIAIAAAGDKGNTAFRFGIAIPSEGEGQGPFFKVASVDTDKDSYSTLKTTVAPSIAAGMKSINNKEVLSVYNSEEGYSRFAMIRKGASVEFLRNSNGEWTGVKWRKGTPEHSNGFWGCTGWETADFNKKIPSSWSPGSWGSAKGYRVFVRNYRGLPIDVFLVGDLAYLACITGRENHSSSKCLFCRLPKRDWTKQANSGEAWTLDLINENKKVFDARGVAKRRIKTDTHEEGVKADPLFPVAIKNIIVPVLHLGLGIAKSVWDKLTDFIVAEIEVLSPPQRKIRLAYRNAADAVEKAEEELDIFERVDLNELVRCEAEVVAFKLKQQTNEGRTTNNARKENAALAQRKHYDLLMVNVSKAEQELKKTTKEEKEGNFPIGPIQHAVEEVLLEFKIRRQAYFGGAFIGPHVKTLTENASQIFQKIIVAVKGLVEGKDDLIDEIFGAFSKLYCVLDVVCRGMRSTTALSRSERVQFRRAATMTGVLWRKMFPGAPITPKLHVLEKHAANQLDFLFCLGVFSEDSIEKEHHIDRLLNEIFGNVGKYEVRSLGMEGRVGMKRHAGVMEVVAKISASNKRGKYIKGIKAVAKNKIKEEQQDNTKQYIHS